MLLSNIHEVLRYLGAGENAPEALRAQAADVSAQLSEAVQPRYVWRLFPITRENGGFFLPQSGLILTGHTAETMLSDCVQAVLLCCTLGAEFETLLRREQARDMARAAILDACGSALVEAGCDAAERELAQRFPTRFLTDRFSPGYGDLPLTLQPALCTALDTRRRLGVHVTASFLLNPTKSVTAILGLSDRPQMARVRGCKFCAMRETCQLYKGGTSCVL